MNTKPVYLIDDDAAVRDALALLMLSHGYTVRAFESGETFLAAIQADSEGVAVLDVRMPGLSGLDVFDRLREQDSELIVIFLSGHGDIPMAVQAVKQGAFDFLEKPCSEQALLNKIDDALEVALGRQASRGNQHEAEKRLATLSPREREVMERVLAGKLNKQIADELNIAIRTVEVHRANVFAKMGVRSALDLAQLLAAR
ncbi:response regulator transcription factor [Chitinimonas taiwanensis]|jgi:two-component system response regulator DctR|uniref:Two component transcriptional regulator, LuxR family n=1 Tax=Chitinimonas taiwanensis DSM 18899 TaxID=1121279 RepID=A0A1K2HLY1_9NEIS|nr:response regulator [Chitinimonas taiwanensis]SFZ77812.1 two component transcriptional regulator, LuxR family [Chitinimonas taiwanensis DSM 18899]